MGQENLRDTLEALRLQLQQVEKLDEPSRKILREVQLEIQRIVHTEEDTENSEHWSVTDRINLAIQNYSESHPEIAQILRDLNTSLSNMGI